MTSESRKHTLPATANSAAGPALWRRLSIEEATRHGWWDWVLRLAPSRRDPAMAAKALRDLVVARRMVTHLAHHLGWAATYFRGFDQLDSIGLPDDDGSASPTGNHDSEPHSLVRATAAARLAETLLECQPMPSERLLASIAEDAALPARLVATSLGHALQQRGRHIEAARWFDAILAERLQPLPELREDSDRWITIVEYYRRHKIIFCEGRFQAFRLDLPAALGPSPSCSAEHFQDVVALVDAVVAAARAALR
jgi:hypothetical protein